MRDFRQRLIHLYHCRGTTRQFIRRLLKIDPKLMDIYSYSSSDLHNLLLLPQKNANLLLADLHSDDLVTQINKTLKEYDIMTIIDQDYPKLLKEIKDPPIVLFLAGDRKLLQRKPTLSVIGTRNPSKNAYHKTAYFLQPLMKYGWTIVSGLARGIDSFAHEITINHQGVTVAVLGGGFKHLYPQEHMSLYNQIVQTGIVLSEYPPHVQPRRYHFPERNRIISGLSYATLVIEATERSGTLITVDQALDQGRQVYVSPGDPLIQQTKGCHRMIQDGAQLVMGGEDIIKDWQAVGKHLMF